eukprot:gene12792-12920_t
MSVRTASAALPAAEHPQFDLDQAILSILNDQVHLFCAGLALNKYFEDPSFMNYLRYLEYWRQPQYVTYIRFPHCLQMLDLLQSENFRKAIATPAVMEELHTQQAFYWQHYLANRIKEAAEQGQGVALKAAAGTATPDNSSLGTAAGAAGTGGGMYSGNEYFAGSAEPCAHYVCLFWLSKAAGLFQPMTMPL